MFVLGVSTIYDNNMKSDDNDQGINKNNKTDIVSFSELPML